MKKGKENEKIKKAKYLKPVLTKQKKLKDVTGVLASPGGELGCTRF